ncbi:uncharacterized protein LOC134223661 [Armigeres subalbatus]|uniref:uncharacterized protein LOC134223661 n=1 Tax=Armigeres subalbatus TaxID=124917 RepID=UPI002ED60607
MASVEAEKRLRRFSFRDDEIKLQVLNSPFVAKSEIDVINILGQAMNMPLQEFKDEQEEKLLDGKICMFSSKNQNALRKITKQMRNYRFQLIPLVLVVKKDGSEVFFETLLIKVHCSPNEYSYVDVAGRIYDSFNKFLDENKFPRGTLFYPERGNLSLNIHNKLRIERYAVGASNADKQDMDAFVGLLGITGSIGCIFATGGMAIPFALVTGISALYATKRGIENLVDADQHGISVNPFEVCKLRSC